LIQGFGSVSLLLHGDGTNGSTTIIDSSPSPKTVTAVGNAQISTAQSKFGGASIAFDGTGDYLTTPSNSSIHVLGSDFTLEAWIRTNAAQNDFTILSTYNDAGSNTVGYIVRLTSTAFRWFVGKGGPSSVVEDRTFAFTSGQWYHIAVTSSSNVGRIFIDGSLQGATFDNSGTVNSTQTLQIGRTHTSTLDFNGYIDDLRITKGVARYTANFTPPTAPFPDF
jgi:hypothetical protein